MVKMKKHVLYIALGLLALAAVITAVLAVGGVVTLPVISRPAIEQPAVFDSHPQNLTAGEVEAMIEALPQPVTGADSVRVLITRLAYRELPSGQQAQVRNLALLEAAEQTLAELGRESSESGLTVIGVDSRVTFTGGDIYASSRSTQPARQFTGTATCRVTFYAEGAAHPFHLVSEDGSGVYGWVDENVVRLG